MYIYIDAHIYTFTCMYVCIYIYTHTHICEYLYIHTGCVDHLPSLLITKAWNTPMALEPPTRTRRLRMYTRFAYFTDLAHLIHPHRALLYMYTPPYPEQRPGTLQWRSSRLPRTPRLQKYLYKIQPIFRRF